VAEAATVLGCGFSFLGSVSGFCGCGWFFAILIVDERSERAVDADEVEAETRHGGGSYDVRLGALLRGGRCRG